MSDPEVKYWVNARGAKSVSYKSLEDALHVAKLVKYSFITVGEPHECGILHALVRMIKGEPRRFDAPRGHRDL